jgi:diphosphoinositol-polyphosphate diphosphatase
VLLVTSSARPDNWIVPGGGVEPNEEPRATALREVREEAGVVGELGRCLGIFEVSFIRFLGLIEGGMIKVV